MHASASFSAAVKFRPRTECHQAYKKYVLSSQQFVNFMCTVVVYFESRRLSTRRGRQNGNLRNRHKRCCWYVHMLGEMKPPSRTLPKEHSRAVTPLARVQSLGARSPRARRGSGEARPKGGRSAGRKDRRHQRQRHSGVNLAVTGLSDHTAKASQTFDLVAGRLMRPTKTKRRQAVKGRGAHV